MSFKKTRIENSSLEFGACNLAPTGKKPKPDDDTARLKKANRLKENLRQMLMPDNLEDQDTKKKNAIYAYNYFEKVEETFVGAGKETKFKKFLHILKSFDAETDNAVNLYHKLEKLFLPEHQDLLDIFLTFLQPTEAYQAGKFFEHFMVTSMHTFINKLNVYFNKQPAQIRKICNCLNELSGDTDLSMEKIKAKILPLLKGNQYLTDWFLQIFPDEKPPDSLLQCSETVNLKEIDASAQSSHIFETMQTKDLEESTTSNQSCQLRYINGRIFYGSRLMLPAKLGFMAEPVPTDETGTHITTDSANQNSPTTASACVHGIRQLGEEYLKARDGQLNTSGEENEKSEDDEVAKEQPVAFEFCDEAVLRMHAARLNPSLYSSENYSGNFYKSNRADDGKCSPKKQLNRTPSATASSSCAANREKYKSPKKNVVKSPLPNLAANSNRKASSSNELNVFATARKLKALCEEECNDSACDEQNKLKRRKIQKNKCAESENENDANETSDSTIDVATEKLLHPWTRDEDKIILEEAKLGFESHEELMSRIVTKLSGRQQNQVYERYKFLMDVLSQLQNKY